jgi:hypothetical protein
VPEHPGDKRDRYDEGFEGARGQVDDEAFGLAMPLLMFGISRLDDIPRSVPAIQVLLLITGIIGPRLLRRNFIHRKMRDTDLVRHEHENNILVVGANQVGWFYVRMLDSFGAGNRRVLGILDDERGLLGRSICGHVVLGSADEASSLVCDFEMHGTTISTFVICGLDRAAALAVAERLQPLCHSRGIRAELLGEQLGISEPDHVSGYPARFRQSEMPTLNFYFRLKRTIDVAVSSAALFVLAPVFAFIALLILAGSGLPIVFWRRRIGRHGQSMFVYKFRTMLKPVDRHGRSLINDERRSRIGTFLRANRLDELPQLFSVLRGSMSLIGPRPLLPGGRKSTEEI